MCQCPTVECNHKWSCMGHVPWMLAIVEICGISNLQWQMIRWVVDHNFPSRHPFSSYLNFAKHCSLSTYQRNHAFHVNSTTPLQLMFYVCQYSTVECNHEWSCMGHVPWMLAIVEICGISNLQWQMIRWVVDHHFPSRHPFSPCLNFAIAKQCSLSTWLCGL